MINQDRAGSKARAGRCDDFFNDRIIFQDQVNARGATDRFGWSRCRDHAGRPHSDQLRVEERFHRVDGDNMQLTVTIYDPKMYSEPWVALNKFPLHRMPGDFDIPEQLCSPVDVAAYNKAVGGAAVSGPEKK